MILVFFVSNKLFYIYFKGLVFLLCLRDKDMFVFGRYCKEVRKVIVVLMVFYMFFGVIKKSLYCILKWMDGWLDGWKDK